MVWHYCIDIMKAYGQYEYGCIGRLGSGLASSIALIYILLLLPLIVLRVVQSSDNK